jgi:hypothetical protein
MMQVSAARLMVLQCAALFGSTLGAFGDKQNAAIGLQEPIALHLSVEPIALHRQATACPKGLDYKTLNPFVVYVTGHMRTFRNSTGPHLQNYYCRGGSEGDVFLSVMATRAMDSLAHDSKKRVPRSSKLELNELAEKTPFCDPFYAIILEDATIAKSMPNALTSFFGKTGKDMHGKTEAGGTQNPKQEPMEMLGRLNLVYLQHTHRLALAEYEKTMGYPMPPEQLIIKMRPDAEPAGDLMANLHGLAAVFKKNPDAFFTSYHPVWGLNDIVFITTRQVMDKLVRIDMNCVTDGGLHKQSSDNYRTPEIFLVCSLKAIGAKVFYFGGGAAMFRMDEIQPQGYASCPNRALSAQAGRAQDIKRFLTKPTAMKRDTAEDGVSYAENTFGDNELMCDSTCVRPAGEPTY